MPSVTDVQQQQQQQTSSNISGKQTPPPTTTIDTTNLDPLSQAVLVLEKKQRNLGKRKEKLEGYQELVKKGQELNKDQKEALAKYPDVLGQIDCLKELSEQFKKIQTDSAKNQKRLSKQAAEEKRQLVAQNLRQYAQIRYLIENRPTSIKPEESSLLDQLSSVIIPLDNSSNLISRSIEIVLSIYQNGPATIVKNLTGKTPQEVREILEELIKKQDDTQQQQQQQQQTVTTEIPTNIEQEQEQIKEFEQRANDIQLTNTNDIQLANTNVNEYPLQFDTRNQNISLEQIIQDNTFFPIDLNNQLDEQNNRDQSPDPKQYLQTITVVNSNINEQTTTSTENQQQQPQTDEQQSDEQWQNKGGNGHAYRGGQYTHGNYHRGGSNNYYQQQRRGGPRGGRYDNSYGGNQRPYYDNNRGRGAYRGNNRGGNYRPYNNNNNNANGYQKSTQHQQAHSAPPSQQQQNRQ